MKNIQKFIIPVIIILIALAVAQGLYYFKNGGVPNAISKEKAAEKAINYINANLLQGSTATLVEVKSESGIYSIKLKVDTQEYTSYITKDGKVLFPQGIALSESTASEEKFDVAKKDKPEASLFVMSFCPYGNQAEELMMPVVDLLKDKVDIQLHYVIYSNYKGGGSSYCLDKENKYCSMHGIQELNQDVRELCVQKYQNDKFWNFVKEINATCGSGNVDTCWEGVAQKAGIDVNKIKTCQKDEAVSLLENEIQLNTKYEISGSPQIIINDKEYDGSRSAEGFKSAICSGFNEKPSECSQSLGSDSGAAASGGCE